MFLVGMQNVTLLCTKEQVVHCPTVPVRGSGHQNHEASLQARLCGALQPEAGASLALPKAVRQGLADQGAG